MADDHWESRGDRLLAPVSAAVNVFIKLNRGLQVENLVAELASALQKWSPAASSIFTNNETITLDHFFAAAERRKRWKTGRFKVQNKSEVIIRILF